jgi:preprotein translocase subunit SecY
MASPLSQISQVPELRKRIFYTLLLLTVYRLGVFVSTPGIDIAKLKSMFEAGAGSLYGLINMFSGGALENFSIFTLGIAPYISVSIIIQLLSPTIPFLDQLRKDGDSGRRILTRYTRIGTLILALIQGYFIAVGLESQDLVLQPGYFFRVSTAITLATGTCFIMWLGEQITERGLGNGISIIIFAGIVARMPSVFASTLVLAQTGEIKPLTILFVIAFCLMTIALIVYAERTYRKIPVQYPRRTIGNKVTQQQMQYLPLKLNMAGVIPPIFASALLILPNYLFVAFASTEKMQDLQSYFLPGSLIYESLFCLLIIVFSYFYTSLIFNPEEVSDNLKKNGGFIPSIRPGKQTTDYLYKVLNALTLWGALYIAIICILPQIMYIKLGVTEFAYVFGGTAILIVVGVTLDTASQIESFILSKNYESFMNKASKMKSTGVFNRTRILRR